LQPKELQKMKNNTGAKTPNAKTTKARNSGARAINPTRREFLRTATGAGLALASSPIAAWADHHGHPSPNSISYLDRRMYIRNMEILAHFMPGHVRNGKMQLMSIGNRRYMFQQGDVIDVSDVRKPQIFNKGGFQGGQVQVAYNKNVKKWILMTGAQTPITDSTPEAPMGKYDDPHLDDKRKNYKGLRGVRFYDVTDPNFLSSVPAPPARARTEITTTAESSLTSILPQTKRLSTSRPTSANSSTAT
jgi:hypothetical protein